MVGAACSMGAVGNSGCCSVATFSIWLVMSISVPLLPVVKDAMMETTRMKAPGDLFEEVCRLAYAEGLVARHEVAGEAFSLAILQQHRDDEQDAGDDDKHNENRKYCVHILNFTLIFR